LPEQRLGQIPGSGGSARLQKIVGITRTKDIVMRSKRISARQALDWGIATDCIPDTELEAATDSLVDELRSFPLLRSAQPKSFSTTLKMLLFHLPSSSKAIATAACANRTTSKKVSKPSTPNARRNLTEVRVS
jgi:enoyl-CoA hydratase/carnithine racemase